MLKLVEEDVIINPFNKNLNKDVIVNIASSTLATNDITDDLLKSQEHGRGEI